jgi:stress response protein YsnF
MSYTSGNTTKSAFPMLDMMLQMQRIGMRAMTLYQPVTSAFLDAAKTTERVAASGVFGATRDQTSHEANAEQVVAIGEEVLNVGTRVVPGKTTRVRRVVVESPVQQDVTLHTETVVVERRRPQSSIGQDVLTEVTLEMSDTSEVPVISKSVHLVEEVLLRKEVTARTETIRDTVKRDKLEIEEPSQLPVVFNPAQKQDEKKRAGENQERKQSVVSIQAESKSAENKR